MISFLLKGDISFLDLKEIKKRYLQDSLFYKIATIEDWSDWKEGESYTIENKIRPDLLIHEEVLSPDNTTLLSTGAHVSYIHNKRLHIANLKKNFFPDFPSVCSTWETKMPRLSVLISALISKPKEENAKSFGTGNRTISSINFHL